MHACVNADVGHAHFVHLCVLLCAWFCLRVRARFCDSCPLRVGTCTHTCHGAAVSPLSLPCARYVPVPRSGPGLVGLLQVCNKAGGAPFTKADQALLEAIRSDAFFSTAP